MAKTTQLSGLKNSTIIWQEPGPEMVGEPAIVITSYSDVVEIRQEGRYVNINYETIADLCKLLKSLKQQG